MSDDPLQDAIDAEVRAWSRRRAAQRLVELARLGADRDGQELAQEVLQHVDREWMRAQREVNRQRELADRSYRRRPRRSA